MGRSRSDTEPTGILVPDAANDTLPGANRTMPHDTDPTWPPSLGAPTVPEPVVVTSPPSATTTEPGTPPVEDADDVLINGIRHLRAPPKVAPRILSASDGDTAAAYYAGPREPNTRFDTPPPEPAVEVFVTSPLPLPVNAVPAAEPAPALPHASVDRARADVETVVVPRARGGRWLIMGVLVAGVLASAVILAFGGSPDSPAPSTSATATASTTTPSANASAVGASTVPSESASAAAPSSAEVAGSAEPVVAPGVSSTTPGSASARNARPSGRPSAEPVIRPTPSGMGVHASSASPSSSPPAAPAGPAASTVRRPDLSPFQ